MNTTLPALALLVIMTCTASAQQLTSRAQLETILDDQIIIDDFENISVHSGGSFPLPNPATAANSNNAVKEGLTFTATTFIDLFGGFSNGDDDVFLRATGDLTIDFDQPQIAIGVDLSSGTTYTITIRTRDNSTIEQFNIISSGFIGYNASNQGVISITIAPISSNGFSINNLTFGADFTPCPVDLNNDGVQDFFDISAFLTFFANEDDNADLNDDGQYDFFDVSAFLTAYTIACP